MKKIFSFLFIISFFYTATAQQIVNRAGPANTVQDQRLAANLNFILPRFTDTAQANNSIGIDLCGAQIYTTNNNTIWYRQCLPKRWIKIMSEITGNCGLTFGGLVTGAGSGLTLDVTSAQYCIANSSYYYPGGNITLSPADPLYDRFDALALDNTGALIKITGTPAPNPAIPTINPATQVFLTAVQVKAGSGSLGATQFLIWDENTGAPEWDDASSSTYDPNATILPAHGSKHIIFNNPANNNNIRFTGTPVNSVDYNTLKFFIKLSAPLSNFRNFTVLINTSGNLPNTLTLTQAYGFNKNDTNYQNITIPLADFNAGTCTIDAVIIRYTETSDEPTAYPGFYLDYLTFNGGTSTPPVLGGYLTNVYKVTGSDSVYKTINGINSFAFNDNTTDTAAIIMAEKVNDTTVRYCRRSGYCFYVTIVNADSSGGGFDTSYRRLDSVFYVKDGIEKFSHLIADSNAIHTITTPDDTTLRFSNLRGGNTDVNLSFYDSWSRLGNNIYRNVGNVGLNTTTPTSKLNLVANGITNTVTDVPDSTGFVIENRDSSGLYSSPPLIFKTYSKHSTTNEIYPQSIRLRIGPKLAAATTGIADLFIDAASKSGIYSNKMAFSFQNGIISFGTASFGASTTVTNLTCNNITGSTTNSFTGAFSAMSAYNKPLSTGAQFVATNRGVLLPNVSTSLRSTMDLQVDSITTTPGTGYTSAPTVSFVGASDLFYSDIPTATTSISGGSVTGATVTKAGKFSSSTFTANLVGGGGSGATATVYTSSQPAPGTVIYNTDTKRVETWDGTAWRYSPKVFTGTAAPTSTPEAIGDTFIDTVAKKQYVATGTASSADWTITN